jgi:hypothetical protein
MFDIATDIFRAVLTGVIFFYLRSMRGNESPRMRRAWIYFIIGFGLLFLGGLLNIVDNFPSLNRFLTLGRHHYAEFMEQFVGYFFGLLFVGIGFWQWIPAILALKMEEASLRKSQEELKQLIVALTAERDALQVQVKCVLAYASQDEAKRQENVQTL